MALSRTRYVVSNQDTEERISVVDFDHTNAGLPIFVATSEDDYGEPEGRWLSVRQAEELRRDLGRAIRQAKGGE